LLDKRKLYVTLLPTTIAWLKKRGNASGLIDYMVAQAIKGLFSPSLFEELEVLRAENLTLKHQRYQLTVLMQKIDARVDGYRSNAFSKGIKELKDVVGK
jgi:predicted nucleic acid-binding protein